MLVSIQLRPSRRQLRQFGWIAAVGFPALALGWGRAEIPLVVLGGLAVISLVFSLVWPEGNRPLFVLMSVASYPIGFVVSHIALAILFFGILTPVGLLFRVLGRDPLARRFEPDKTSYWVDLPRVVSKKDYFRQF